MSDKKQTAVDFLWEEMQEFIAYCGTHALANELNAKYLKAKEMEKDQMFDYIKENYVNGENSLKFHQEEFEKHYNNNFGVQ